MGDLKMRELSFHFEVFSGQVDISQLARLVKKGGVGSSPWVGWKRHKEDHLKFFKNILAVIDLDNSFSDMGNQLISIDLDDASILAFWRNEWLKEFNTRS